MDSLSKETLSRSIFNVNLSGRTALVCGASAGIGEASARALAHLGARVILLSRNEEVLTSVSATLPGSGHKLMVCDLNDHERLSRLLDEELKAASGKIEILVNNSTGPKGGPVLDAAPEEFTAAFHQHLLTSHILVQKLCPGMKEASYGRIINILSTSVKVPISGLGVSNTIRASVASWAKTLSLELAPFGITVNSVLPGYTETPRLASLMQASAKRLGKTEKQIAEDWLKATPAGRFGKPEETAAAVAFLASPGAAFITGVALPVDGGRTGTL